MAGTLKNPLQSEWIGRIEGQQLQGDFLAHVGLSQFEEDLDQAGSRLVEGPISRIGVRERAIEAPFRQGIRSQLEGVTKVGTGQFQITGLSSDLAEELVPLEQFVATAQKPAELFDRDLDFAGREHRMDLFHVFRPLADTGRKVELIALAVGGSPDFDGVGRTVPGRFVGTLCGHLYGFPGC